MEKFTLFSNPIQYLTRQQIVRTIHLLMISTTTTIVTAVAIATDTIAMLKITQPIP